MQWVELAPAWNPERCAASNLRAIAIVDTETTGFAKASQVVEFGAVLAYLGEYNGAPMLSYPVGYLYALVNPGEAALAAAHPDAFAVNGLNAGYLRARGTGLDAVGEFLRRHRVECYAFNAAFDSRLLEQSGLPLAWGPCIMQRWKVARSHLPALGPEPAYGGKLTEAVTYMRKWQSSTEGCVLRHDDAATYARVRAYLRLLGRDGAHTAMDDALDAYDVMQGLHLTGQWG